MVEDGEDWHGYKTSHMKEIFAFTWLLYIIIWCQTSFQGDYLRVEWRTLKNKFAHFYKSLFFFLSELIYKEILDYQSKKEEESVQTG